MPSFHHVRFFSPAVTYLWAAVAAVAIATPARVLTAQCVSDLRSELVGLTAISDSIMKRVGSADTIPRATAEATLRDIGLFAAKAGLSGTAATCVMLGQSAFQQAALASLPTGQNALKRAEIQRAASEGVAAVLASRYAASDRVSLVFGIAMTALLDASDAAEWKIISRTDSSATPVEKRYIANESNSRQFPSAATGVLVRLWDPGPRNNFWRRVTPHGVFGSVQISNAGDTGPVNGAALGISWKLVADTHFLVGYSISRRKSLRDDLSKGHTNDSLIPLPPGETSDSILGTNTANGIMWALVLPVSLRSALGGK
jgi:hypothetical protein